jgi:hypothetical protein
MHCPGIYWHLVVKELQESKEDLARGGIQNVFSPQEDIQPTGEGICAS